MFVFQQATLLDRMHIIPQAEYVEPPRERKDDLKPGMSNVKVLPTLTYMTNLSTLILFFFPRFLL